MLEILAGGPHCFVWNLILKELIVFFLDYFSSLWYILYLYYIF